MLGVGITAANLDAPLIPPEAFVMKDETSGFFQLDHYSDSFDASFKAGHYKIEFPNNVTLFVANTVPEATVKAKASEFYKTYSETRAGEMSSARFNFWGAAFLVAMIAPLVLLGLGFVVAWIVAGFVREADP
jgi:hypothetical protein